MLIVLFISTNHYNFPKEYEMGAQTEFDIVESARLAWNIISAKLDKEPKVYTDFKEFEKFYADILKSLLEEEEQQ